MRCNILSHLTRFPPSVYVGVFSYLGECVCVVDVFDHTSARLSVYLAGCLFIVRLLYSISCFEHRPRLVPYGLHAANKAGDLLSDVNR